MNNIKQQSDSLKDWAAQLIARRKNILSNILLFAEKVSEKDEIEASLITIDLELQQKIGSHPGLLWKAQHVKKFKN